MHCITKRVKEKVENLSATALQWSMSDSTPVMLRLLKSELPRLDRAAKRMGTNRSALAKFLLRTFLDKFESGGFTALPHDWQSVMRSQDGRTIDHSAIVAEEATSVPPPKGKPVKYAPAPRGKRNTSK
jgi:hypothetical protein